jgi:hypothetical protein
MPVMEVKQSIPLGNLIWGEAPPPRRVHHILAHSRAVPAVFLPLRDILEWLRPGVNRNVWEGMHEHEPIRISISLKQ